MALSIRKKSQATGLVIGRKSITLY